MSTCSHRWWSPSGHQGLNCFTGQGRSLFAAARRPRGSVRMVACAQERFCTQIFRTENVSCPARGPKTVSGGRSIARRGGCVRAGPRGRACRAWREPPQPPAEGARRGPEVAEVEAAEEEAVAPAHVRIAHPPPRRTPGHLGQLGQHGGHRGRVHQPGIRARGLGMQVGPLPGPKAARTERL
jgi:hypothetical protein